MGDAVEGTLLYWILDGAAHLDLPSVRDVVLAMLSDPPGERLQARLRVTKLRAMYEETENLGPVIGEMVALFDDVVPHSDPSSCGPDSPWFFLRTATLVRAATQNYDDEPTMRHVRRLLKHVPQTSESSILFKKKCSIVRRLTDELDLFAGDADPDAFPTIYRFTNGRFKDEIINLLTFLEKQVAGPLCFLSEVAVGDDDDPLSPDVQACGFALMQDQINAIKRRVQPEAPDRAAKRPKASPRRALDYSSPKQVSSSRGSAFEGNGPSHSRSASAGVKRTVPAVRADSSSASSDEDESGSDHEGRSVFASEELLAVKSKRMALHRAAANIEDPLQAREALDDRVKQALANGIYERWEDSQSAASGHRGVSRSPAVRRVERPSQGHRLSDVRLSLSKAQAKADRSSDVAGRSLHHVPSPAGGKERRKTKKWTRFEEENIIKGIGEFGEGNWKDILLAYEFQSGRTTVDIKDKWRNMARRRRQTE
ncbi:Myb-like DNA-binding domain containing protein [Plasmodiophora brassicae]|uniref:Uncharacterized protein n=1 Tax=Plasmodiophora brassicae TaxID=37360 RepID=A0A0G4J187_PLABS|nr:hypothetical protein PBRA_001863 [Plasmodiophora brassicae]SPR01296.1 unnamed protein product [Plasmodiophora brassicae]